jgi:hypothetical protein
MSGDRSYASVPERITWTTGFRCATDKLVLGALSTFANFETGKGARMSAKKLAARAQLKLRTVERGLQRLKADAWIIPHPRHRHATVWDINLDRLAKDWIGAKLVGGVDRGFQQRDSNLTATYDGQLPATYGGQLAATRGGQDGDLTATYGGQGFDLTATRDGQPADLTATSGGPIPCTEDLTPVRTIGSPVEPIPSAPALRAGSRGTNDDKEPEGPLPPWEEFNRARQSQARTPDLRADSHPHQDDGVSDLPGRRGDHPAAPSAGVPLRQAADSPRAESADRPRAPVEPTQPGLGLLADVNAPIGVTPSEDQHRQFMADLRARVGLRTSADVDDQEQTG